MSVFYRACDDCPARDSTVLESVRVPGRGGGGQGGRRSQKTSDFLDFRDQWPRTRQRIRESWQNKPHLEKRPFSRVPADSRSFGDAPWPAVKPCAANSRRALRGTSARGGGGHRGAVTAAFVAAAATAVLAACERVECPAHTTEAGGGGHGVDGAHERTLARTRDSRRRAAGWPRTSLPLPCARERERPVRQRRQPPGPPSTSTRTTAGTRSDAAHDASMDERFDELCRIRIRLP